MVVKLREILLYPQFSSVILCTRHSQTVAYKSRKALLNHYCILWEKYITESHLYRWIRCKMCPLWKACSRTPMPSSPCLSAAPWLLQMIECRASVQNVSPPFKASVLWSIYAFDLCKIFFNSLCFPPLAGVGGEDNATGATTGWSGALRGSWGDASEAGGP